MKRILLILVFTATFISAQQVYFVHSYTEDGEPIGAKNEWDIKPWGSFVYVLLDVEDKDLKGNVVYMFVDKMTDGEYKAFDSKAINIKYNPKWVVYNYKFTQTGEYDVYFVTTDQERFAGEKVTIKYEESFTRPRQTTSRTYYDNCKITFCKKVLVGGDPLGVINSISLSNTSSVFILINNYNALNTSKLLVDVWKKRNRMFEYDEFVESKKYRINPDWPDAFFKYTFSKPGEYKFSIYNENEVGIQTGYFTVSN